MKTDTNSQTLQLAREIVSIIDRADKAGVALDDGNIVDLIADNVMGATLDDIRRALVFAGCSGRFPKATQPRVSP